MIVLRVVIRSPDLDTFVSKYSRFIKDDRIFIFTKSSQPPGTRVRFTLELADGQPLIDGEGTVTRIRPDSGDASKPPGMELRFIPLDEASRVLVDRMLRARESTGQFSTVTTPPPPPSGSTHFREETTDAQTNIRDSSGTSAIRELDESVPTLAPLEKTGALPAMDEPSPRQDESGAVTLAQAPPGERGNTPPPSLPLGAMPAPPLSGAPVNVDGRPAIGRPLATPTPLPAPMPAGPDEFGGSPPPTKLARPSGSDSGASTAMHAGPSFADSAEPAFASAGPAPMFAEAFRTPIPGQPPLPPGASPTGTVPANPFSEVSDGAIEYFVEWSLEQSTAPKPKVAEAHFANVVDGDAARRAAPVDARAAARGHGHRRVPRAAARRGDRVVRTAAAAAGHRRKDAGGRAAAAGGRRRRPGAGEGGDTGRSRRRRSRSRPAPSPPSRAPSPPKPSAVAAKPSAVGAKPSAVAAKPTGVAVNPTGVAVNPTAVAVKPVEKSDQPAAEKPAAEKPAATEKGELSVISHPAGAAVTVDGEPRGKTPLALTAARRLARSVDRARALLDGNAAGGRPRQGRRHAQAARRRRCTSTASPPAARSSSRASRAARRPST